MNEFTGLIIGGEEVAAIRGEEIEVLNPTSGARLGRVAHAREGDLARAVEAAECLALEVGKPLEQGRAETLLAADNLDWGAEEGRRAYGRVIPARFEAVMQTVVREPVGVVAAFTPWNFPVNQAARKLAGALGSGCSVILKAAEEAPASAAHLGRALIEAGVPARALNLLFGTPAEISRYLLTHRGVAKIAFTGSTAVGKQLSALAGAHMKRSSMELGRREGCSRRRAHRPYRVLLRADRVNGRSGRSGRHERGTIRADRHHRAVQYIGRCDRRGKPIELRPCRLSLFLQPERCVGDGAQGSSRQSYDQPHRLGLPETPMGGVRESGYGLEGGAETLEP